MNTVKNVLELQFLTLPSYLSGDNPVYVQSVKEHGAAWRAGLRAGDRILRVDSVPVHHHTHQQVVHMIRGRFTSHFYHQ